MGRFLEKLMGAPEVKPLLSDEHFSVDGTLLQAWASHTSLERIDGQDDPPPPPSGPGEGFGQPMEGKKRAKGDFRGVKLSNQTHRSTTDPVDAVFSEGVAVLARKSNAHPAQPSYRGHVLKDNRHALIVDCKVTQATGTATAGEARCRINSTLGTSRRLLYIPRKPSAPATTALMVSSSDPLSRPRLLQPSVPSAISAPANGGCTATAVVSACWPRLRATSSCASPRIRAGSFFLSQLKPRRRVDRALWAVVMEAYVSGVSTRKVDEPGAGWAVRAASPTRK